MKNILKISTLVAVLCLSRVQSIAQSTLILPGSGAQSMTTAQRTALTSSVEGTLVYDTDTKSFWYWKNGAWTTLVVSGGGSGGALLHTDGTMTLRSELGSGGQTWLGASTPHPLHLHTDNGAGAKISLFPNGHVGINYGQYSPPPAALDVLAKPEYASRFRGVNPYVGFNAYDPGSADSEQFGFIRAWTEHGNVTGLFGLEIGAPPRGTLNVAKHLVFSTNYARRMMIAENGNVNIGTSTSTTAKLTIEGTANQNSGNTLDLRNATLGPNFSHAHWGAKGDWYIRSAASDGKVIIQDMVEGYVGIGTSNPDPLYRLSVNGTIRAKEVIVETNWADFVFDKNYHLRSLASVERFIKTHKHLPDFPSAVEVQYGGAKIAELTTKMMQKIEELTLYSIAQDKRIKQLEKQLAKKK